MKITLGKDEIADAVECYLARQGLKTDGFDLDVRIVVSRSSEDNKIEVDMVQKEICNNIPNEPIAREDKPFQAPFDTQD